MTPGSTFEELFIEAEDDGEAPSVDSGVSASDDPRASWN
jgi:hypothetical protein